MNEFKVDRNSEKQIYIIIMFIGSYETARKSINMIEDGPDENVPFVRRRS